MNWRPICELTDDFRSRPELLLWLPADKSAVVGRWSTAYGEWQLVHCGSYAEDADLDDDPSHFALIEAP